MIIWFDLLSNVNDISKSLQNKDMRIDCAIKLVKGLINYLEKYRETGLDKAIISAKNIAIEMEIEPVFVQKRQTRRKRQFDENLNDQST